jgi:hypothetical protein
MRSRPSFNHQQEHLVLETPERTLWLAVIERALKDYCFFFDRVLRNNTNWNIEIKPESFMNPKAAIFKKRIGEFQRLRWFLFNTNGEPFNLEYLADILYEPEQDMAGRIRSKAAKVFKRHLDEARASGIYPVLVEYVDKNTGANNVAPAPEPSPLRYKRYRIKTDV